MTAILHSRSSTADQRRQVRESVSRVDALLYQSICIPDTEFNRGRRRHIHESLCCLTLIYSSLVSEWEGVAQSEVFLFRFEKMWRRTESGIGDGDGDMRACVCQWGRIVIDIFRALLVGGGFRDDWFMRRVLTLVDVCTQLDWEGWRTVKEVLMEFFVGSPACQGTLQNLWRERVGSVSLLVDV